MDERRPREDRGSGQQRRFAVLHAVERGVQVLRHCCVKLVSLAR